MTTTVVKRQPPQIYAGPLGLVQRAIDNVVATFAPRAGARRVAARAQAAEMLRYEAAKVTRTNPSASSGSADAEILPDLQRLRDRSRAMVRDDAHGAAGVRVFEENVIGKGLSPQSTCTPETTGLTEEQCEAWRRSCEAEFLRWSEHVGDITGQGSFGADVLRIVARALFVDGEAIGHMVQDGGEVRCELIDADRLESPGAQDTDRMRGGVELNEFGAPIAYNVLKRHPADVGIFARAVGIKDATRLPASDRSYSTVQHVFMRDRPGQTRGVPWLASALNYSNHLHHYLNSELIAARANSNVAMYVTRSPDTAGMTPVADPDGGMSQYHETLEAGIIEYLNPGEQIAPFLPNRPGTQFDPFVKRLLRAIWAAPGLAYELITKDYGSMNYSSARSLLLECRRSFDHARALIVRQFARPWWNNVVRAAVAAGRLVPPRGFTDNPDAFLQHRWVAPSYGWIDPTKEIDSAASAIAANLSTPYDEASRAGYDAEEVVIARARFERFVADTEKQYGLQPGTLRAQGGQAAAPAPAAPAAPPAAPGESPQDGEDNNQDDSNQDSP